MKDVMNTQPFQRALRDHGPSRMRAGPGLGLWLLPMVLVGSAVWIAAVIFMIP